VTLDLATACSCCTAVVVGTAAAAAVAVETVVDPAAFLALGVRK
jgi:hypothetical protein